MTVRFPIGTLSHFRCLLQNLTDMSFIRKRFHFPPHLSCFSPSFLFISPEFTTENMIAHDYSSRFIQSTALAILHKLFTFSEFSQNI